MPTRGLCPLAPGYGSSPPWPPVMGARPPGPRLWELAPLALCVINYKKKKEKPAGFFHWTIFNIT
jgi:hypothetical protein